MTTGNYRNLGDVSVLTHFMVQTDSLKGSCAINSSKFDFGKFEIPMIQLMANVLLSKIIN